MKKKKTSARRTDSRKRTAGERCSVAHGSALWQPAATAPKTRVILAYTGYPWPLPCLWDAEAGKWAVAFLNVESQNAAKESQNVWWETEYECALLGWAEMPAMPNTKATDAEATP